MTKRVIACLAALTLALSLLPVTALADELEVQTFDTTVEELGGESDALLTTYEGEDPATPTVTETEGETTPTTTNVAKIGDTEYATLDEAIEAAEDGATITLLANCETAGLNLDKNLTIAGSTEKTFTVTFKDKGIALWGKALTFKNCAVSMTGIGSTPYTAEWNKMAICASEDASLTLENATMTMDGTGTGKKAHAIYFCSNNRLNLTDSKLTIRNYAQDALEWDGGDGGYNVNLTNSTFVSDHNRSGFTGSFVATFDNSKVDVINSTGNGSNGTYYTVKNGSKVLFDGNGYWGISAWRIDMSKESVLTATNNGYSGIWTRVLNVDSSCTLDVEGNGTKATSPANNAGIFFQGNKEYTSTIEKGANVTIVNNAGSGIYTKQAVCNLTIGSATITNNGAGKVNKDGIGAEKGGGVYNVGTMVLGEDVVLYNNHAAEAGDDIYSTGTITFGSVGSNWTLNDCNHHIDGWYYDGQEKTVEGENGATEIAVSPRWNGETTKDGICLEGKVKYYELFSDTGKPIEAPLALKAAHGYLNNNPPVIRDQYYTVTVNYVDEAGNTVAPSYSTGSLKSGTAYDVTAQDAIAIPGYSYKTTTGDPTTGTLNGNKVVTVVYTKTADIDDGNTPTDPGDPGSDIDDPNTPTSPAEPPKTGDMMPLFAALTTLSAAAIVLLSKKREEA